MQSAVPMRPNGGLQGLRLMIVMILCLLSSLPATASSVETYPIPNPLTLTVRETAGVGRTNEIVRSGVPLARSLGVRDTTTLAIADAGGHAIPAEFRVLARWNAGRNDASAAIQWLLVAFPVTIAANHSSTYRLVIDGSAGPNPAPETPLSLTQIGDRITVNTGAGIFVLGGTLGALFDELRRGDGTLLVSGSALTAALLRASELTGEDDVRMMGADLTRLTLSAVQAERPVLDKIAGLYFARLPAAVAILARQDDPPLPRVLTPAIFLPLVWQHRSPNRSYEVYGSSLPYFIPGPATLLSTITPPFSDPLSYQDAAFASPRFYYVVGVNAAGQRATSDHIGRCEMAIVPGQ